MSIPMPNGNEHMPAWKRLGLKLKFASDGSQKQAEPVDSELRGQKRLHDKEQFAQPEAKRSRASKSNGDTSPTGAGTSSVRRPLPSALTPRAYTGQIEASNPAVAEQRSKTSRRSVTFTPETKTADGDSAKDLLRAWEEEYDNNTPTPLRPNQKKLPQDLQRDLMDAPQSQPNVLIYLDQYYNDRAAWKFNKSREIHILSHILSNDHIPTSYNPHLLSYLQGLKSQGARARLRKAAQDAIDADDGDHTQAVEVFTGQLKNGLEEGDWDDRRQGVLLQKRKRAELVLWAINQVETIKAAEIGTGGAKTGIQNVSSPSRTERLNGTADPDRERAKKRKNRTNFVNDSSTSSSENSDNGSDSDSRPVPASSGNPETRPSKVTRDSSGGSSDSTSSDDSDKSTSSEASGSDHKLSDSNGSDNTSDSDSDSDGNNDN